MNDMNTYLIFLIVISNSLKNYCDCQLLIFPKSNVLQGEKVNISCQIKSNIDPTWFFNNNQMGEGQRAYDSIYEISSDNSKRRFDFIIRNATLKHQGLWKCLSDKESYSINLNVSVPWSLKAIQIKKLLSKNSNLYISNNSIETGEKRWPYDLLKNHSLRVICKSKCGLPGPKSILVKYGNSTKSGELSGGTQKSETCPENSELLKMTHNITINCQLQRLTGLNKIHCESQDSNGNLISNKPVFILCPAFSGMDVLTLGEKVAIVVSVLLAIIDVVIIVLLLRKNFRELSDSKFSNYKIDKSQCSEVML